MVMWSRVWLCHAWYRKVRNMNIEIILSEQLDKCGDEYLDEKDVPAIFKDWSKYYMSMEIEGRTFLIKKDEFRKLTMITEEK